MLNIVFLEEFMSKIFNQEFVFNNSYKETLLKAQKVAIDKDEHETIEILLKGIDNEVDDFFKETNIINDYESYSFSDIRYVIYVVSYVMYLMKLHDINKIELKDSNLKDYIKIARYLEEKIKNNHELVMYSWLPFFIEGFITYPIDCDFSIIKLKKALQIAEDINYNNFPLSYVYDRLGLLYYEKGYFDDALDIYNKGFAKWPNSTYLLNNRAFLFYVLKDKDALDVLNNVVENSKENDPYGPFNLASYKLYMSIFNDQKIDLGDVPKLLKQSFIGFLEGYKKSKSNQTLLEIFPCAILENIIQSHQRQIKKSFDTLSLNEKETIASQNLLLNLFCDLENFITDSYVINEKLSNFLSDSKSIIPTENIFIVLKRWSSYTPLVPRKNSFSRGGGHFFSWKGKGFIVDPGPNFLENFIEKGFKLADIDCIICSHGHIDHTQDLERIITLLYEKISNNNKEHKIRLILSPGCASKYGSLLSASSDVIESCVVLYSNKKININDLNIAINPILSNHNEIFARKDTALSFIIELKSNNNIEYRIGFTNDTGFNDRKNSIDEFFNCELNLLIANLGSDSFARINKLSKFSFDDTWYNELKQTDGLYQCLKDEVILNTLGYNSFKDLEDIFFKGQDTNDYEWYKTHLGFRGLFRLAIKSNYQYMIISEFGEELKSYRHLFAKSLNKTLGYNGKILTGDVGTKFRLIDSKLMPYCEVKNNFIDGEVLERVVKNEDYRVIHFDKKIMESDYLKKELQNMFGFLI